MADKSRNFTQLATSIGQYGASERNSRERDSGGSTGSAASSGSSASCGSSSSAAAAATAAAIGTWQPFPYSGNHYQTFPSGPGWPSNQGGEMHRFSGYSGFPDSGGDIPGQGNRRVPSKGETKVTPPLPAGIGPGMSQTLALQQLVGTVDPAVYNLFAQQYMAAISSATLPRQPQQTAQPAQAAQRRQQAVNALLSAASGGRNSEGMMLARIPPLSPVGSKRSSGIHPESTWPQDQADRRAAGNGQGSGDHRQASVDHRQAPAEHRQPPVDHRQASMDHRLASVDHRQASVDHRQASMDHRQAPVDHRQASVDHRQAPVDHRQAPVDHRQASVDHRQAPVDHRQAPVDHRQAPVDHRQAPVDHRQSYQSNPYELDSSYESQDGNSTMGVGDPKQGRGQPQPDNYPQDTLSDGQKESEDFGRSGSESEGDQRARHRRKQEQPRRQTVIYQPTNPPENPDSSSDESQEQNPSPRIKSNTKEPQADVIHQPSISQAMNHALLHPFLSAHLNMQPHGLGVPPTDHGQIRNSADHGQIRNPADHGQIRNSTDHGQICNSTDHMTGLNPVTSGNRVLGSSGTQSQLQKGPHEVLAGLSQTPKGLSHAIQDPNQDYTDHITDLNKPFGLDSTPGSNQGLYDSQTHSQHLMHPDRQKDRINTQQINPDTQPRLDSSPHSQARKPDLAPVEPVKPPKVTKGFLKVISEDLLIDPNNMKEHRSEYISPIQNPNQTLEEYYRAVSSLHEHFKTNNPTDFGQNQAEYGKNPADYGQNPADYGQNPADYGQNPADYGQNPADYGQNPADYGQNPAEYGKNPADYGKNPADYGKNQADYGKNQAEYGKKSADYGKNPAEYGKNPADYSQNPADYGQNPAEYGNSREQIRLIQSNQQSYSDYDQVDSNPEYLGNEINKEVVPNVNPSPAKQANTKIRDTISDSQINHKLENNPKIRNINTTHSDTNPSKPDGNSTNSDSNLDGNPANSNKNPKTHDSRSFIHKEHKSATVNGLINPGKTIDKEMDEQESEMVIPQNPANPKQNEQLFEAFNGESDLHEEINDKSNRGNKDIDDCNKNPIERGKNPTECGKNPLEGGQNLTECDKNPTDCGKNSTNFGKNPTEGGKNPAECGKNPIECAKNPTNCAKNPTEGGKNPAECKNLVEGGKNPADCGKNPTDCGKNPAEGGKNPAEGGKDLAEYGKNNEIAIDDDSKRRTRQKRAISYVEDGTDPIVETDEDTSGQKRPKKQKEADTISDEAKKEPTDSAIEDSTDISAGNDNKSSASRVRGRGTRGKVASDTQKDPSLAGTQSVTSPLHIDTKSGPDVGHVGAINEEKDIYSFNDAEQDGGMKTKKGKRGRKRGSSPLKKSPKSVLHSPEAKGFNTVESATKTSSETVINVPNPDKNPAGPDLNPAGPGLESGQFSPRRSSRIKSLEQPSCGVSGPQNPHGETTVQNPSGDISSLQNPSGDTSNVLNPHGEVSCPQNASGEVTNLQNPHGDISSVQKPSGETSNLQNPHGEVSSPQNPQADLSNLENSSIGLNSPQNAPTTGLNNPPNDPNSPQNVTSTGDSTQRPQKGNSDMHKHVNSSNNKLSPMCETDHQPTEDTISDTGKKGAQGRKRKKNGGYTGKKTRGRRLSDDVKAINVPEDLPQIDSLNEFLAAKDVSETLDNIAQNLHPTNRNPQVLSLIDTENTAENPPSLSGRTIRPRRSDQNPKPEKTRDKQEGTADGMATGNGNPHGSKRSRRRKSGHDNAGNAENPQKNPSKTNDNPHNSPTAKDIFNADFPPADAAPLQNQADDTEMETLENIRRFLQETAPAPVPGPGTCKTPVPESSTSTNLPADDPHKKMRSPDNSKDAKPSGSVNTKATSRDLANSKATTPSGSVNSNNTPGSSVNSGTTRSGCVNSNATTISGCVNSDKTSSSGSVKDRNDRSTRLVGGVGSPRAVDHQVKPPQSEVGGPQEETSTFSTRPKRTAKKRKLEESEANDLLTLLNMDEEESDDEDYVPKDLQTDQDEATSSSSGDSSSDGDESDSSSRSVPEGNPVGSAAHNGGSKKPRAATGGGGAAKRGSNAKKNKKNTNKKNIPNREEQFKKHKNHNKSKDSKTMKNLSPYVKLDPINDSEHVVNTYDDIDDTQDAKANRKCKTSAPFYSEIEAGQQRAKLGYINSTLHNNYDSFTKDLLWFCALCKSYSHTHALGDLFGPIFIQNVGQIRRKYMPTDADQSNAAYGPTRAAHVMHCSSEQAKNASIRRKICSTNQETLNQGGGVCGNNAAEEAAQGGSVTSGGKARGAKRHVRKESNIPVGDNVQYQDSNKKGRNTETSNPLTTPEPESENYETTGRAEHATARVPEHGSCGTSTDGTAATPEPRFTGPGAGFSGAECWFHELCLVWSSGVTVVNSRLSGLEEAVGSAQDCICNECGEGGATIGCLHRGCRGLVHYPCAARLGWGLNAATFESLCPQHKSKKP